MGSNVFHHRTRHITEPDKICQDHLLPHQRDMSQQQSTLPANYEGRL
jgi:hypothetical protein